MFERITLIQQGSIKRLVELYQPALTKTAPIIVIAPMSANQLVKLFPTAYVYRTNATHSYIISTLPKEALLKQIKQPDYQPVDLYLCSNGIDLSTSANLEEHQASAHTIPEHLENAYRYVCRRLPKLDHLYYQIDPQLQQNIITALAKDGHIVEGFSFQRRLTDLFTRASIDDLSKLTTEILQSQEALPQGLTSLDDYENAYSILNYYLTALDRSSLKALEKGFIELLCQVIASDSNKRPPQKTMSFNISV